MLLSVCQAELDVRGEAHVLCHFARAGPRPARALLAFCGRMATLARVRFGRGRGQFATLFIVAIRDRFHCGFYAPQAAGARKKRIPEYVAGVACVQRAFLEVK